MKFLIFALFLVASVAGHGHASGAVSASRVCHIDPHNCQYCSKLYYCAECVQDADNCCFHADFHSPAPAQGISDKVIFMINKLCTRPLTPTKSISEHCAKQLVNPYNHGFADDMQQRKRNDSPVELEQASGANAEDDEEENEDEEHDRSAIAAEDETTITTSSQDESTSTGMPVLDESTTSGSVNPSTSTPISETMPVQDQSSSTTISASPSSPISETMPVQDEITTPVQDQSSFTSTTISASPSTVQEESGSTTISVNSSSPVQEETTTISASPSSPISETMPVQDEITTPVQEESSFTSTTISASPSTVQEESTIVTTLGVEETTTSTSTPVVSTPTVGLVGSSSISNDIRAPENADDRATTVAAEEATTVAEGVRAVEETTTVTEEATTVAEGETTSTVEMESTTTEMIQKGSTIADNCKKICPMSKSPQKCVKCVMEHRLCCFGQETGSLERERDHYVAAKNLCFV